MTDVERAVDLFKDATRGHDSLQPSALCSRKWSGEAEVHIRLKHEFFTETFVGSAETMEMAMARSLEKAQLLLVTKLRT